MRDEILMLVHINDSFSDGICSRPLVSMGIWFQGDRHRGESVNAHNAEFTAPKWDLEIYLYHTYQADDTRI
jgi:hypothetical protein